ncbi:hypothetical protein CMI47_18425 [Candidatus Pacearchaeota archaeon]|jgi:hypothetical protein|nr:hypothetical protein [Candidatus Pacearchaeota archaeon]|tara:strand:+ start:10991 stop:11497 length:507 start_codon:yes stop_codon:yes gene_type:complete
MAQSTYKSPLPAKNQRSQRSNTSSRTKRHKNTRVAGGKVLNQKTQPDELRILLALDRLNVFTTDMTLNEEAETLLWALDCTVSNASLDKLTDTDTEMLANPNIETQIGKKPTPTSAVGKFTDINGPFYKLDPAQRKNIVEEERTIKKEKDGNYIRFASNMTMMMKRGR